jgi:hypothetical protein
MTLDKKFSDLVSGLTRKVLLNNCAKHASVDFPEPKGHNLPRRAQSMRVTPLLRVMGRDTGSGTPSPMSSPSPSSDEEDGSGSPPARTPRRYKSRENFGSLVIKKFIKQSHSIEQCFSTWVPRNPQVPPILYRVPRESSY